MILTNQQKQEFETLTRSVMEWLNRNCHPHVAVTVDSTHAELSEGVIAYTTHEYVRD